MTMKIYKTADKKLDERRPDGDALALYTQTLKMYLRDNPDLNDKYADLIKKLPSPRQISREFSKQECKLLYETLEYLWMAITGGKLVPEKEIIKAPETLSGNYLMLCNGILLAGLNTTTIIKKNSQLLCTLLDINAMTLMEYLASPPDKLIEFILKNGAMRLYINPSKKLFAQCSPETYGKWSRAKLKKLDFDYKAIKVIDFKTEYKGWSSGVLIRL